MYEIQKEGQQITAPSGTLQKLGTKMPSRRAYLLID